MHFVDINFWTIPMVIRYQQLKCVQTHGRKQVNVLELELSVLHSMVQRALQDDNVQLIPMVSIVMKKYKNHRSKDFR